jgi:type IV pilus assembly protein PilX
MRTERRFCHRRVQRGAVLLIALIVLVAMSLAGVALVRGVDMTNLIAGNLAFKQGATLGGDWGAEQARTWLAAQPATSLQDDIPGRYFASMQSGVDFTASDPLQPDFNWSANSFNLGADPAGNPEVRYIVHRMCDVAGPAASVNCVRTSTGGTGQGTKGGATYSSFALPSTSQIYYRITVRSIGPRNTVSYVQVMVN